MKCSVMGTCMTIATYRSCMRACTYKNTFLLLVVLSTLLISFTMLQLNQGIASSNVLRSNTTYLQSWHLPVPKPVPIHKSCGRESDASIGTRGIQMGFPLSCCAVQNIAYIKTLKTGSTTIMSIINRYGFFHNLSFILNRQSSTNGHFYHLPFTEKTAETHFLPPIHVAENDYPNYKNYNMMAVHVRYQRPVMERFFAQGTKYMTIIRDPGMQWESAFIHFQFHDAILVNITVKSNTLDNSTFLSRNPQFKGCREELLKTSQKSSSVNQTNCTILELIEEFLSRPKFYQDRLRFLPWEHVMGKRWAYSRNNQIYDLGLDPQYHKNTTAVKEWIQKLQDELSLVLINEYFDESLLIMRKRFCWSFQDIAYIAKNIRIKDRRPSMRDSLRDRIREWNAADTLLYQSFNRTLWYRIDNYGPGFGTDLVYFRNLLESLLQNCTQETEAKKWDKDHLFGHQERVPRKNVSLFCRTLAESKRELHTRVYCRQDVNRSTAACKVRKKQVKVGKAKANRTNLSTKNKKGRRRVSAISKKTIQSSH
ncbi:galactose-3-O-sulfotransferase 2-like [Lytechinus pictus]|uniref:galactose-3-O-sulfotransferase 2-like n=1 Tax=Lytechinus pictus TaxID=7653 RepID=UPI0030B9F84E